MTETPTKGRQVSRFGWLIDNFTERVAGVAHAVVISVDGLLLTASKRLPLDRADQMAAIAAGIHSLNMGAAKVLGAETVNRAIVEMDYGVLLLTSIKDGSCMAVLARRDSDIAQIAYEMTVLVDQVGQMLTPELRAELSGSVRR
ncbi:roadblock/LC7 domain-containing protein [Kibdelosporangium aridum]|uniref:Roadblock/LC7 domain-containing protein n=1 Tax=Kibdelosporangium aridum TaxID=2030 RepID=A0A428ZR10_KIBAR|nr:roadblock/LC7 domain-containing protein [Kibdelosporangium aridum]RSM90504.1 roadblock/LC7 domain-containing protein [Kibdelosporangium aridum]